MGPDFTRIMEAYEYMAGMWLVGEDMPQKTNCVTLHPTEKDQFGIPIPNVHFDDHAKREGSLLFPIHSRGCAYGFGQSFPECMQLFRQTKVMRGANRMDGHGPDTFEHFQAGQESSSQEIRLHLSRNYGIYCNYGIKNRFPSGKSSNFIWSTVG
jgi:hypothetical protein